MFFRHHEGVAASGLRNIKNREDVIVFIDFGGGDFPFDDFTEYVFHNRSFSL